MQGRGVARVVPRRAGIVGTEVKVARANGASELELLGGETSEQVHAVNGAPSGVGVASFEASTSRSRDTGIYDGGAGDDAGNTRIRQPGRKDRRHILSLRLEFADCAAQRNARGSERISRIVGESDAVFHGRVEQHKQL